VRGGSTWQAVAGSSAVAHLALLAGHADHATSQLGALSAVCGPAT
jgi:hypothetical protein